MRIDENFQARYRAFEERMRALAEADGDVFVPTPKPEGPVQYALICMEPSLARWARSADEVKSKVDAGFRNFLFSIEDLILHISVRRYLCRSMQRYHITDFSKGAMLVKRAAAARDQRYDRWYALLQEEIDLVTTPDAGIIAVGKVVSNYLGSRGFQRPFTGVIHYSNQAAYVRSAGIVGREDDFEMFRNSVSLDDLVATARDVLRAAHIPAQFRDETVSRLARSPLTTSRKQLIFNYKVTFESMRL